MDRRNPEAAHADFFPDEIGRHFIPFPQAQNTAQAGGNAHAEGGIHPVGKAFDENAVDPVSAAHDALPDDDGRQFLHPGKRADRLLGGQVDGDGLHLGRIGRDADIPRHRRHPFPDRMAETGRDGDGEDNHKETHGDRCRRDAPLEFEFTGYEGAGLHYQIWTRSSCGRNIGSPSSMSKASKKVSKLRRETFTRFTASEWGSRLVRRAFSWSVMFWAHTAA